MFLTKFHTKNLKITSFLTIRRFAARPQEHCRPCTVLARPLARPPPAPLVVLVRPRVLLFECSIERAK